MIEAASYYDSYWASRDAERTGARSRRRAALAVRLLGDRRGTLLEVGAGPGWALEVFRDAGFEARGVDVSPEAVESARSRGLDVAVLDATSEEIEGTYDVVAALEVLEHVVDPLALLRRLAARVATGGRLVISLPNELTLQRRLGVLLGRPGFGGHEDPHVRHFDIAGARRLIAAAGLQVESVAFDGLAPPRWGLVKRLTDPLATMAPGLFAISGVWALDVAPRSVAPRDVAAAVDTREGTTDGR